MGQRCGRSMSLKDTEHVNLMEEGKPRKDEEKKTTPRSVWRWFLSFFTCILPCLFRSASSEKSQELPEAEPQVPEAEPQVSQELPEAEPQVAAAPESQALPQPAPFVNRLPDDDLGHMFMRLRRKREIVDRKPVIFIYPASWDEGESHLTVAPDLENYRSQKPISWMMPPEQWVRTWFNVSKSQIPKSDYEKAIFVNALMKEVFCDRIRDGESHSLSQGEQV